MQFNLIKGAFFKVNSAATNVSCVCVRGVGWEVNRWISEFVFSRPAVQHFTSFTCTATTALAFNCPFVSAYRIIYYLNLHSVYLLSNVSEQVHCLCCCMKIYVDSFWIFSKKIVIFVVVTTVNAVWCMCGESFRHLPDQGKNNNYTLVVFIQLLLNYKKKHTWNRRLSSTFNAEKTRKKTKEKRNSPSHNPNCRI